MESKINGWRYLIRLVIIATIVTVNAICNNQECLVVIATFEGSFLENDETGEESFVSPAEISAASLFRMPPHLIWLRSLLYPPAVTYCLDELNGEENYNNSIFSRYKSKTLNLDCKYDKLPDCISRSEINSKTIEYRISCFNDKLCTGRQTCISRKELQNSVDSLLSVLEEAGVPNSSSNQPLFSAYMNGNDIIIRISSTTGGQTVLMSLLLSNLQLFRHDKTSLGPFRLANKKSDGIRGIDKEYDTVRLVRNRSDFRTQPNWPVSCNKRSGEKLALYCFKKMPTLEAAAKKDAGFDLLLTPYDPYIITGRKQPKNINKLELMVGTHVFAAINAKKIGDIQERIAIYKKVLIPSVELSLNENTIESLTDKVADYWFPLGWEGSENVLKNCDRSKSSAIPFSDLEALPEIKNIKKQSLNIIVIGMPLNPDSNPLLKKIDKLFKEKLGVDKISILPNQDNWPKADIILFLTRYDPIVGDPSSLLLNFAESLKKLAPIGSSASDSPGRAWLDHLRSLRNYLLENGPNNCLVADHIKSVQAKLKETAFIYPLYHMPYYIFYRTDHLSHIEMNYKIGFANLNRWKLHKECN